jgi:hypothetical protein
MLSVESQVVFFAHMMSMLNIETLDIHSINEERLRCQTHSR